MEVTEELTRKVAHLARLDLSDEEVAIFTPQLKDVLKYVEQLAEVNVDGVEPMNQPLELETPYRDDVVIPFGLTEDGLPRVMQGAPEVEEGGYRVPQIL